MANRKHARRTRPRRPRMRWLIAAAVVLSGIAGGLADGAEGVRITHGPMLGGLTANSVRVWARTSRPTRFFVVYGTAPDQMDQQSPVTETAVLRDNTGWVELSDLAPATTYYYRVQVESAVAPETKTATFRTLPDAESVMDARLNPHGLFNFSFEFACGNRPQYSEEPVVPRPTFATLLRDVEPQVDFAILNGDWIYEVHRDLPVAQWQKQTGVATSDVPRLIKRAPGIVGVWENYKYYLDTDPLLAEWHREVPSFFLFDDHEILNDLDGTGEIGYRNRRTLFRDVGVEAWYHYLGWSNFPDFEQPVQWGVAELRAGDDVLTDPHADFSKLDLDQAGTLHVHWGSDARDGDPNAKVYEIVEIVDAHRLRLRPQASANTRSVYSIGRRSYWHRRISNCEFYFLDTRSERKLHDKTQPDKPGVSMIGAAQKKWLKQHMVASDADFLFVVSTVNFMIPHVDPKGRTNKDEAWTSFLREREELIEFWDDLGKPVFVLTGDLHNSFAIQITDRVWEFASGPHSSTNHSAPHEANRPPNGPFQSGPRRCDIRWSSYVVGDLGRSARLPHYCVVQVNNVFRNPGVDGGKDRWIAFPRHHVVFQYYEGHTGRLAYAESIFAAP